MFQFEFDGTHIQVSITLSIVEHAASARANAPGDWGTVRLTITTPPHPGFS